MRVTEDFKIPVGDDVKHLILPQGRRKLVRNLRLCIRLR
jgi:hypothetical protein